MGDRMRALRESRKLTQEDMGKIIGISGAAVAQWELGTVTGIKPENLLRFCTYFGVDPYWLVFGPAGDPRAPSSARVRKSG